MVRLAFSFLHAALIVIHNFVRRLLIAGVQALPARVNNKAALVPTRAWERGAKKAKS